MASPSPVTPAPLEKKQRERKLQFDGENQGMDSNKTPQKKKPKRKKYTPKVIREGKPVRTPKTPAKTMESTSSKKKYVRKKAGAMAMAQPVRRNLVFEADQKQADSNETPHVLLQRGIKRDFSLVDSNLCSIVSRGAWRMRRNLYAGSTFPSFPLICKKARSKRRKMDRENAYSGWSHDLQNTFGIFTVQQRKVVFNQAEREKNSKSVQAHSLTSCSNIADCPKVSTPTKPSDHNYIDCNQPLTHEKVFECRNNQENKIYCAKSSDIMSVFNQELKGTNDSPTSPCSSIVDCNKVFNRDGSSSVNCNKVCTTSGPSNIDNMGCHSQPSTPEKAPGCSSNQEHVTYGPQARIEVLIAKQLNSKGRRRMKKEQAHIVIFAPSNANQMLEVAIDCKSVYSVKESAPQSRSKKVKHLQISPIRNSGNNYKGSVFPDSQLRERVSNKDLDNIVQRLRYLNINGGHEDVTALVPYTCGGGMMVPFKGSFNLIKKQRPRAMVDLDPESNREWELLMGKKSTEGENGTTEADKEKFWEEERRLFFGRVYSFIGRMQQTLGNREFTKWGGSVVDSVVGVFLTQNVSDVLSSSAFMSLAARFPLHSKGDNNDTNRLSAKMTEQQLCDRNSLAYKIPHYPNSYSLIGQNSAQPATPLGSEVFMDSMCLHPLDGNNVMFQQTVREETLHVESTCHSVETQAQQQNCGTHTSLDSQNGDQGNNLNPVEAESNLRNEACMSRKVSTETLNSTSKSKKVKAQIEQETYDWDSLRREAFQNGAKKERTNNTRDYMDYEAVRCANVSDIAYSIRKRGQNNLLSERIQKTLNRLLRDHGSIDLEWLKNVPPDKAKDYLLSIEGLGIKSVECVRLLTLQHQAFPVDTNVGRICVRLGWVPLLPLPESLQLHLLEMYPVQESIQKYLWPRLCKLDHATLYMLHCLLITFGKVFCTKSKPNCNACPMRGDCKHFASAFVSARLGLPRTEDISIVNSTIPIASQREHDMPLPLPQLEGSSLSQDRLRNCQPIIEEPASPELECVGTSESDIEDIEDAFYNDLDEIPTIKLNLKEFTENLENFIQEMNTGLQDGDMSKALVSITPETASIPMPKLKNVSRMCTTHQVYVLKDDSYLLKGLDKRDPDDPCPYLLAIWSPGETAQSTEPPKVCCISEDGNLCDNNTCFSCNGMREAHSRTVRGTILIPCRTANKGSFPLNGTYFQVNEVFADHYTSHIPLHIPRDELWPLERRTVYFGTSVSAMLKGVTMKDIQDCFWKGYVCVRAFNRDTRKPKPLCERLHLSAIQATKIKAQQRQKTKRDNTTHDDAKLRT